MPASDSPVSSWYAPNINGHAFTKQQDESFIEFGTGLGYVDKDVIAKGIIIDGKQIVTPAQYERDLPALGVTTAVPVDSKFLKAINDSTKRVSKLSSAEMGKIRTPTYFYGIVDEYAYNNGIPSEAISRDQFRSDLNSLGLTSYTLMPSDIFAANNSRNTFRPGFPEATAPSQ